MAEFDLSQPAAELKAAFRAHYGIGWKACEAPRNLAHARCLGCELQPPGLCCLVLEAVGDGYAVRLSPCSCPEASINLEYLSLALRVRREEDRDPLFSLDPDGPEEPACWQVKRFEPSWLAGTSAGEVMFQADVYLKELSMGEHPQPVVGMRSCLDIHSEEGSEEDWDAREWFVIKEAEVRLSPDSALVPHVVMGVCARVLKRGPRGLEDSPLASVDHPLARYARDFSHYFDLIAERQSVVHHLRELAKASVLAKFLIDPRIQLDDRLFALAGTPKSATILKIPQLWNERLLHSGDALRRSQTHRLYGLYGGVQLRVEEIELPDVDTFQLTKQNIQLVQSILQSRILGDVILDFGPELQEQVAEAAAPAPPAPAAPMPGGVRGLPSRGQHFSALGPEFGAVSLQSLRARGPPRGLEGFSKAAQDALAPRGVDLGLRDFDLRAPHRAAAGCAVAGRADLWGGRFWSGLRAQGSEAAAGGSDAAFCLALYNPFLCDRRAEGEFFVPPRLESERCDRLRRLLEEEGHNRHRRRALFGSSGFSQDLPGPLFPPTWASASTATESAAGRVQLHARPDCKERDLTRALACVAPEFDRDSEDGARFRIYRLGDLEVRAVQEYAEEEVVVAVFSARPPLAVGQMSAGKRVVVAGTEPGMSEAKNNGIAVAGRCRA